MNHLLVFILIGFVAQLIDGSLGMGYKVTSTTFLLSFGIPPTLASATVHTASIFTSGTSALAHIRFGNVDRVLVKRLAVPGVLGGLVGVIALILIPVGLIKPLVSAYLLVMGVLILRKALQQPSALDNYPNLTLLGLAGGFFDAVGGGGWGPIVTSNLVATGHQPRFVIGSVNTAEVFVTVAQAALFLVILSTAHWEAVIGLIVGGIPASVVAAHLSRSLPHRKLMLAIGAVIIVLSFRTLLVALNL